MEAHDGRSVFVKHARNIGRAYRNQTKELISICLIFSRIAPQFAHEDAELRRVLRACDLALHSAVGSAQKVTDEGNKRFEKATRVLCRYFERWRRRFSSLWIPILPKGSWYTKIEDKWRPKMMIKFVLLRSPLAALHDPETVVVRLPTRPFPKFFGTLAVTRTVHASPSSKTLTSIPVSLRTRVHTRLCLSAAHFET
ncbi:hypothetical protein EDB84DRAFT_491069 [Lactarius hengduanensis]|nr:hypothetical protein EDB84DRAFT_491069 [Lactarius hengduanensis]